MKKIIKPSLIHNLNFWHLTCILGSAMGFPAMLVGGQIASLYGNGRAIISICLGNLILWLIGLGVVSMSESRNNAVENIKKYLGDIVGIAVAIILMLAFLIWHVLQTEGVATIYLPSKSFGNLKYFNLWIGVAIGLCTAIISIKGIIIIKWVCSICLPLLLCFAISMVITSNYSPTFKGTWGFSFWGTISVLLTWLPGIVNLPTFFRHSCSKGDSFFALSLMTAVHIFFQAAAVLSGFDGLSAVSKYMFQFNCITYLVYMSSFILLFYICINIVNIYFASAAWDALFPSYKNQGKFFIIGLIGTLSYIFIQNNPWTLHFSPLLLEKIITSSISNLGVVLIIDSLIKIISRRRPRIFEKTWSSVCWLIGCIITSIGGFKNCLFQSYFLIAGMNASILAFLVIAFIEQTIWSIKNLQKV